MKKIVSVTVIALAFLLPVVSLAMDRGEIYDSVMEYTKGLLLNLSTFSEGAKKAFFNGVSRGVKEALNLTEGMKLDPEKLENGLKSVIKTSLLWRLSGRETKLLLGGFGRFVQLGFSIDGASKIVRRFVIRDLGLSAFKKVSWLVNIAVRKYGVSASSLEAILKKKLSMLDLASKKDIIKGIIISIKEKIREAKRR